MFFYNKYVLILFCIILIPGCEQSNIDIKKSYKNISKNLSHTISSLESKIGNSYTDLREKAFKSSTKHEADTVKEVDVLLTNLEDSVLEQIPYDFLMPFDEIISSVILQYPEVQSSYYIYRAAEQEVYATKAQNKTQITGALNAGGVNSNIGTSTFKPGMGLSAGISQVIYDGGYNAGSIGKSAALSEKAKANYDLVKNKIGFKAASAWINLWVLNEKLKEVKQTLESANPILADIKRMAESGLIDRTIVDNTENSLLKISLNIQKLESDKDLAELHFESFFGKVPVELVAPKSLFEVDIFESKIKDIATIPSLRVSAAELVASREEVKAILGEFKPKVSFNLSANSPTDPDDNASVAVGINSTYTFSDGGRLKARLEVAKAKSFENKFALESAKIEILKSIKSDIKSLKFLEQSRLLSQERLDKNLQSLTILKSQILTGQSRLSNLIDKHIERVGIHNNLLDNTAQYEVSKYSLAAVLGIFSELQRTK
jgi:outer membrane protein TolC